jgi:hypothetical protein
MNDVERSTPKKINLIHDLQENRLQVKTIDEYLGGVPANHRAA